MNEAARPAQADELAAVVALGRQARTELRPFRGGELWEARESLPEPLDGSYRRLHESSDGRVVVGLLDDVILGYAVGEVEPLADGRRLGRIHEVFVEEGARGIGLGEAILEELLAWFDDRDCVGIDAPALPGHRQAKNFFEAHGFVARLLVMHHRTAPPTGTAGPGPTGEG